MINPQHRYIIISLIVALTLGHLPLLTLDTTVHAQTSNVNDSANGDYYDNSSAQTSDSSEGEDDTTILPATDLTKAAQGIDALQELRGARGDITIENTLPRLGMSQCDLNLVRDGAIDERVLQALNYLVKPAEKGGAGMTYLNVTFAKECEQDVPELIGGAYPVDFVDDSPQPKVDQSGNPLPSGVPNDYSTPTPDELKTEQPSTEGSDLNIVDTSNDIIPPDNAPQFVERPLDPPSGTPPPGKPFAIDFGRIPASDLSQDKRAKLKDDFYALYNQVIGHIPYHNSNLRVVFGVDSKTTQQECGENALACVFQAPAGVLKGQGVMLLDAYQFGSTSAVQKIIAHELIHTFTPHFLDMGTNAGLKQYDEANHSYEEMITDYFAQKYYPDNSSGYHHLVELVPRILDILSSAGVSNPEDLLLKAKDQDGYGIINAVVNKYLQKPFIKTFATFLNTDPKKMDSQKAKDYLDIVLTKVRNGNKLSLNGSSPTPYIGTNAHTPSVRAASKPVVNKIQSIITPLVHAATTSPSSAAEPSDAQAVHDRGQAVDITAAGLVMCTTKSGGVFGLGAKVSRQAPRPVKVAWQTDQGVANVQAPFGANFNQMAETAGLDSFLEGFTSGDSTFQAKALSGAFEMMGFNLLAGELGIRPGSFDPTTAPLTYSTLGYAYLADLIKLPDATVFNPFLNNGSPNIANPLDKGHDNVARLLKDSMLRSVEHDLKLNPGSLEGNSVEDVLANAGKRRLEKDLGLMPGSFNIDITKSDDMMRSLGQAKMESYFRLPVGSANLGGPQTGTLSDLVYNVSQALGLQGAQTAYAEQLVRGALHLPASANLSELGFKDSAFWKSDVGKQTKTALQALDRQIFPGANGGAKPGSLFQNGKFSPMDAVLNKSTDDLTWRMITGDLSLKDYQSIIGVGGLLTSYGAYQNAARAFDLPADHLDAAMDANGNITHPEVIKNEFLLKLLGGDKNHWLALGVDTIAKALQMNPDQRYKVNEVPIPLVNNKHVTVGTAEQLSGMVLDVLQGKLNTLTFSTAKASLSTPLDPRDMLTVFGLSLAQSSGTSGAGAKAEQRYNQLIAMGKDRFGNLFDAAAKIAIGDPTVLPYLYQYDKTRPSATPITDSFSLTDNGQATFTLSQPAIALTSVVRDGETAGVAVKATLGNDKRTVTVDSGAVDDFAGGDTLRITYTATAKKASDPSSLSPNTFNDLINDNKAMQSIALQVGAAKMSGALHLPPNALSLAAKLVDPNTKGGEIGIGQAALEQAAGLTAGSLSSADLSGGIRGLSQAQVNQIFRLESNWYSHVISHDTDFIKTNSGQLIDTDNYYKIELGSTEQVLNGAITLDQYKKRVGQSQLRYQAGGVLAGKFSVHVLGYRLNAQDFDDLIGGDYYKVLGRIGARAQEVNHGMPIGALAASIISGSNDVSLWSLGTGVVASALHLKSIDLTHVNSITDVNTQVGLSSIEQALGFKAGKFRGDTVLDVAGNVGAESFASAFGFVLPQYIKDQLNAIKSNYRPDLVQSQRDAIVLQYLQGQIGPGIAAEAHFAEETVKRFEAVDHILFKPEDKGSTLKLMQYSLDLNGYIKKSANQTIASGITSDLSTILGIPQEYAIEGKNIIDVLVKGDNCDKTLFHGNGQTTTVTQACTKAFGSFFGLIGQVGGFNFDAALGWDKGAFGHILANVNDTQEMKKTVVAQGAKDIARFLGINGGLLNDFQLHLDKNSAVDMETAFHDLGAAFIAGKINVPGYGIADANYLVNGHFSDGVLDAGAAFMANSKDMKKAGITFDEIKKSILGDPKQEDDYLWNQIFKDNPSLNPNLRGDQELKLMNNPAGQSYIEASHRGFMTDARQAVSYKFMDSEVRQLLPFEVASRMPPGFAKALVGGLYEYHDAAGATITLTGDEARWRYSKDFVSVYAVNNIPVLKDLGVPADVLSIFVDYGTTHNGDDKWLQDQLSAKGPGGVTGIQRLGASFDKLMPKLFSGTTFAPGTGAALIGYAFNGNTHQFENNIWDAWKGQALNWADHALGLKPGTAQVMYQGIVGYQTALNTYRSTMNLVNGLTAGNGTITIVIKGKEVLKTTEEARKYYSDTASRQLKTQTAMIIATVASFVFQKQIGQVETALGLKPGTLMYLIQYLIHPDPISLGLFIFFNFIWGGSSTSCEIDHYPSSAGGGTPPGVLALQTALKDQTAAGAIPVDVSTTSTTVNPITKALTPPKSFDGQNNDSYRKGIKAGAQYEVRRTLGSLLLMPSRVQTTSVDIKPIQIGTFSNDDLLLFEKLSMQLYGPINSRGKRGPGTYDKMTDRIHVGY